MSDADRGSLCDVNVLVALVHDAHEHSRAANRWLGRVRRRGSILVCRVSQLGFLRLITSARIFGKHALAPHEAWAAYDTMVCDDRFAEIEEPDGLSTSWRELCATLQPGAVAGTDVYLAAFALVAKLEIVTLDRGFRRFSDLDVRLL